MEQNPSSAADGRLAGRNFTPPVTGLGMENGDTRKKKLVRNFSDETKHFSS
jgi:hypothetical protein